MIEKIKKISVSAKVLAIISILVFLAMMFPVYQLMFCARLAEDDLWYGTYVKMFLEANPTVDGLLHGIGACVNYMWHNWQGTFSSAAMMSLTGLWGNSMYWLGPIIVTTTFIVGNFLLTKCIAKQYLNAALSEQIFLGVINTFVQLELIYTAQQGIFWYNAAVHYTFMHGMMCGMLACELKLINTSGRGRKLLYGVLFSVLSFVVSGANYVTIIYGFISCATIMLISLLRKNRNTFFLFPGAVVYVIGALFNTLAPGNTVRQEHFQGEGFMNSIFLSLKSAVCRLGEVCNLPVLGLSLLAVPVLWHLVKRMDFRFRYPGLVSCYSFCVYAAGFSSSWYGMGAEPVARSYNVIKFVFIFLLFVNLTYWLGYVARVRKEKQKTVGDMADKHKYCLLYFLIPVSVLLLWFPFEKNTVGHYLTWGSYYYIHSGQAHAFAAAFDQRAETIRNTEEMEVVVNPIDSRPYFLTLGPDNPNDYVYWYNKWNLILEEQDD